MCDNSEKHADPIARMEKMAPVKALLAELRIGLANYWRVADSVLQPSNVRLKAPEAADFGLEKNFFSLLFLYSFYRAGIPEDRRILYAATLQCLRGMVTDCDNLLDDEYKKTLDTNIPETAFRFRSVIDIMVSDRVLFQLLLEACREHQIDADKVAAATAASIKTMTLSGMQEASEEAGIKTILQPDDLLQTVHHYKTGLLFTCPWDIPLTLETIDESEITALKEGLYRIGMGCQIMDDMVDFMSDLKRKRHNFLVSLIYYGPHPIEKSRLEALLAATDPRPPGVDIARDFPESTAAALTAAHEFLESGLNLLFASRHRLLVIPCIQFLRKRIGVAYLGAYHEHAD